MSEMFVPQFRKEGVQSPDDKKAADLQDRLVELMRFSGGNKKEKEENLSARKTLKEEYLREYPEQTEGIEIIFGMKRFLSISARLSQEKEVDNPVKRLEKEERFKILRELTEYQFLITHYLLEVGDKPEGKLFLNKFWRLSEKISQDSGHLERFIGIKKGILGQVASFKILEALDYHPELPHPTLDAFYSIDLLTQKNVAFQVKSASVKEPTLLGIEEVDNIGIPTEIINNKGQKIFINERHSEALHRFKFNLEKLARETKESYKGYEFIIPIGLINENTGTPSEYVVKYFEAELNKRLSNQPNSIAA